MRKISQPLQQMIGHVVTLSLRQVTKKNYFQYTPMGGVAGGIGFVNAPLTASKVRNFKKELGNLVEDPVGISNQAD